MASIVLNVTREDARGIARDPLFVGYLGNNIPAWWVFLIVFDVSERAELGRPIYHFCDTLMVGLLLILVGRWLYFRFIRPRRESAVLGKACERFYPAQLTLSNGNFYIRRHHTPDIERKLDVVGYARLEKFTALFLNESRYLFLSNIDMNLDAMAIDEHIRTHVPLIVAQHGTSTNEAPAVYRDGTEVISRSHDRSRRAVDVDDSIEARSNLRFRDLLKVRSAQFRKDFEGKVMLAISVMLPLGNMIWIVSVDVLPYTTSLGLGLSISIATIIITRAIFLYGLAFFALVIVPTYLDWRRESDRRHDHAVELRYDLLVRTANTWSTEERLNTFARFARVGRTFVLFYRSGGECIFNVLAPNEAIDRIDRLLAKKLVRSILPKDGLRASDHA